MRRRRSNGLIDERADELGAKRVRVRRRSSGPATRFGSPTKRSRKRRGSADGSPICWSIPPDAAGFLRGRWTSRRKSARAKDVAYFAHYEGFAEPDHGAGGVIIGRLESGWSWRIPLPGRLSVSVVLNKDERGAARHDAGATGSDRQRPGACGGGRGKGVAAVTSSPLTPIPARVRSRSWAGLGDHAAALGFVDPMLSPTMWLALRSAELLAERLDDLPAYSREMRKLREASMELIQYDGRMSRCFTPGVASKRRYSGRIGGAARFSSISGCACMACGATTTSASARACCISWLGAGSWRADLAVLGEPRRRDRVKISATCADHVHARHRLAERSIPDNLTPKPACQRKPSGVARSEFE